MASIFDTRNRERTFEEADYRSYNIDDLFQLKYKTPPIQLQTEFEENSKEEICDEFDSSMSKIIRTSFESNKEKGNE